jgi:hypothetical protein
MQRIVVKALYRLPPALLGEDEEFVNTLWQQGRLSHPPAEWDNTIGVFANMPRRSGKSYLIGQLMKLESPNGLWVTPSLALRNEAERSLCDTGTAGTVAGPQGVLGVGGRSLIALDEFAYYENPQETWIAMAPCLSPQGKILGLTSVESAEFDKWPQSVLQIDFPVPAGMLAA